MPLRERLKGWSTTLDAGLVTDILTPIDTTSAYIWLPMVSRKKKIGKISGVYNSAVSILATPLDFRVYLDFGGYAQEDRFTYYQFLKSAEYQNFIVSFSGRDEMLAFDIDWYCFITGEKTPCLQWLTFRDEKIDRAERKLLLAPLPITWNRMLHGYIIDKENLPEEGLSFEWIQRRLSWIVEFYQALKAFTPPVTFSAYQQQHERNK